MRKVYKAFKEGVLERCSLRTRPSASIWYIRCELLNFLKTPRIKERLEKTIDSEWPRVWEFVKIAEKLGTHLPIFHEKKVASKYACQACKQLSL